MPPRRRRRQKQSSSDSKFLFVNEDASTVTRAGKDPDLDREKQSHVQRQNFARRRQPKGGPGATSQQQDADEEPAESGGISRSFVVPESSAARFPGLAPAQSPASSPELSIAQQSRLHEHELATPAAGLSVAFAAAPGHIFDPLLLPLYQSPKDFHQELVNATHRQALANPLRSSQPHPLLSGARNEPAASSSILSQWAPPLMQYWTTVLIRESFFLDTRFIPLSRLRHAPAIHAEMQDAMSHPAHLYSLLAAAAIQMLAREGQLLSPTSGEGAPKNTEAEHMRVILFFKTRALESLREHIATSTTVTHQTVADVLRLLTVAFFSDAYEAAIPHHQAMQSMIASLGGLGTFSDYFVETRVMLHWAANLRRLTRPDWAVADWADPGPGDEEIRFIMGLLRMRGPSPPSAGSAGFDNSDDKIGQTAHKSRAMARGFAALTTRGELAPILREAVEDLADVLRFERYIEMHATKTLRTGGCKPEHFRWANRRHVAMGFRLLSIDPSVGFGAGPSRSNGSPSASPQAGNEVDYHTRNEAIRMALIFTVGLTRSPGRGRRCGSKSIWKLREVLESTATQWTHAQQQYIPGLGDEGENLLPAADDFDIWPALTSGLSSQQNSPPDPAIALAIDPHFLTQPSEPQPAGLSSRSVSPSTKRGIVARWQAHTELLLWVACVGSMTARLGTMDWEWFVGVARECVGVLKVESWDALEELLSEYVYEPAVQRDGLWETWQGITRVRRRE